MWINIDISSRPARLTARPLVKHGRHIVEIICPLVRQNWIVLKTVHLEQPWTKKEKKQNKKQLTLGVRIVDKKKNVYTTFCGLNFYEFLCGVKVKSWSDVELKFIPFSAGDNRAFRFVCLRVLIFEVLVNWQADYLNQGLSIHYCNPKCQGVLDNDT